jgi:MarR family transcriptional regulator, organic hydroperoxide resistance regulator
MPELTFQSDDPKSSPGFLIWKTTTLWQREIKSILVEYDVSHAQFVILAALLWHQETHQTVLQSALVQFTKMDKMTVSKALKQLVHKNHVKRFTAVDDTRSKVVQLRAKGVRLIKTLVPLVEAADNAFFSALSQRQRNDLCKLLSRLSD